MSLDRKLLAYAAGAAAASLAGAEAADAEIVRHDGFTFGPGSTTNINFDSAGAEEYQLGQRGSPNRVSLLKDSNALSTNAYATGSSGRVGALAAGTLINDTLNYATTYDADLANASSGGNFSVDNIAGNPEYLGLRFQTVNGGPTYYGWVGVDITDPTNLTGVVTGYAYETSGAGIEAGALPEPAGLALLALGAPFLMRRRGAARG